jgi:hypothetical protein
MVTKISVFSESPAPTYYKWSIVFFSVSRTVFELFAFFVYNGIFLSRGQFYPFLGPGPQNYEFVARKPQKGTCTNGIAPVGREKFALTGALRPVDEFEKKKDNNKSIRNDKNPTWVLHPIVGPLPIGLAR